MSTYSQAKAGLVTFQVTFLTEPDEEGYHTWAPALKGLHASGKTVEESLEQACELAQLYLETLIEEGEPIPLGSEGETQALPPDATVHQRTISVFVP